VKVVQPRKEKILTRSRRIVCILKYSVINND
jgi:hypothetical protein